MTEEYLTTEEAAARLRVSVETIRRWCRQGKLATVKIGRAHRIPLRALLALDPERTPTETPAAAQEPQPAEQPAEPESDARDDADGETLSSGWTRADPMPDQWGMGYGGRVVIIE